MSDPQLFTPYTNAPPAPDYTRVSNEFGPVKGYSALGTAISSVADVGDQAIKGLDELHKLTIQRELGDGIRSDIAADVGRGRNILAGVGSGASTGNAGLPPGDTEEDNPLDANASAEVPAPITAGLRDIEKRAQAMKLGKFDDISFQADVVTRVQNLTSRFKGYESYINEQAGHFLQNTAQMKERLAIQQTLALMYGNARNAAQKWETEMHSDAKYFGGPGSPTFTEALQAANDPNKQTSIRQFIADQKSTEHQADREVKTFESELKGGQVSQERALGSLNLVAAKQYDSMMRAVDANGTGFGKEKSLKEAIAKIAASVTPGSPPDPTKLQPIGIQLGQLVDGYSSAFDAMVKQPRFGLDKDGNPTQSYASLIKDPAKLEAIKQQNLQDLKNMAKQVGLGHLELATTATTLAEGVKSNMVIEGLRNPTVQRIAALGGISGQAQAAIINNWFTQGGFSDITQLGKTLSQWRTIGLLRDIDAPDIKGAAGTAGMNQAVVQYTQAAKADNSGQAYAQKPPPAFLKQEIENMKFLITNKELPLAQRNDIVGKILNQEGTIDFFKNFTGSERFTAWGRMYSPDLIAERKKAGEGEYKSFRSFGETTFVRLFNSYIDTFNEGVNDKSVTNVRFNPETNQIDYDRMIAGKAYPRDRVPGAATVGTNQAALSIDRLNVGFKTLDNLLKADGEKITPEYLKGLGLHLEPNHDKGDSFGFLNTINSALNTYVTTPLKELNDKTPNVKQEALKALLDTSDQPSRGTSEIFQKNQDLRDALASKEGLPVHHMGKTEVISNSPDTPVKYLTDAEGNQVIATKRDGKWYKIVPHTP